MLFSRQFELMHGLTVDQALSGHMRINGRVFSPEELEEDNKRLSEYYKQRGTPDSKAFLNVINKEPPTPVPIDTQLRNWARNHTTMLVGNTRQIASNIKHINEHFSQTAKPNEVPIYRGADRSPQEAVQGDPTYPLAFSTDRFVATSFAKKSYRGKKGSIYRVDPGQSRGLLLSDYGVATRTVGQSRRPEAEFLADPSSFRKA